MREISIEYAQTGPEAADPATRLSVDDDAAGSNAHIDERCERSRPRMTQSTNHHSEAVSIRLHSRSLDVCASHVAPKTGIGWCLFDRTISFSLLVLCTPLIITIAILNKLTSSGPIFYTQERVGRLGTTFRLVKFRSMSVDAENATGPVFAVDQDARSTVLGAWLRRFCLDELPQLWNVVRGEMSLVGPRPERPFFVDRFRRKLPHYDDRHLVRPGITGWSQVNGLRGCTSIEQRLQLDLEYIQWCSFLFDMRILLLTPLAVLFPRSATRMTGRRAKCDPPTTHHLIEAGCPTPVRDLHSRAA